MYCGYITKIKTLRKHSNADRLQCTEVFGNTVILDLSFKENDLVVYFPVDGQLGEEYAKKNNLLRIKNEDGTNSGGYLDPSKRNIRAIKLRGEKSDGLLMPIESLKEFTDISNLKVGDEVTVFDGVEICKKYIPKRRKLQNLNGGINNSNAEKMYPTFHEHTNTAQLAYNLNSFKEGDLCYITLKMHGTSGRTANVIKSIKKKNFVRKMFHMKQKIVKNWECVSGTRRTILKNYDGGYYGCNSFREKYHNLFKEKLPKGFCVYYEIVGWIDGTDTTIMGSCSNKATNDKDFIKKYGNETVFSYGCEEGYSDVYVYRMTFTNEDDVTVEIPWEQVKVYCDKWGVKYCPEFDKFLFTTPEDLMERVEKYCDGTDPIGRTHIREGVVVRVDNKEKFTAYKHKNFNFKLIEGIIKDTSDAPDIEEAEELIDNE